MPEETIRLAYELLLGRPPENDQVVKNLQHVSSVAALRKAFMDSAEFGKIGQMLVGRWGSQLSVATETVRVEATAQQRKLLFDRIRAQWTRLGETEPHWSVLTNEIFKTQNFAGHEEEFYRSGMVPLALLDAAVKRGGVTLDRSGAVLELGCGTGRVTHLLAERFARVVALDVSPGNLHLCKEQLHRRGKTNVECQLLKSPADIGRIPPVDLFFSTIVLQHNPPPVILYFLDKIFGKIRDGGAVFFQVPTHRLGYSFDVATYLASPAQVMEMHCVPMPSVLALMFKHGLRPVEVLMDGMTGHLGSHTFLAVRN